MWKCFVAILFIGTYKQAVADFALEQCTSAGHPDKAHQVTVAIRNFRKCATEIQNATRFERLLELDSRDLNAFETKLMNIVHSVCGMKTEIKTCYTVFYDGVSPCFDSFIDGKANKEILGKLIDYVCYNNSNRLADIIKDGAISCLKDYFQTLLPSMLELETLQLLPISEACDKYQRMATCVGDAINKHCAKRSISDYVTGFLNIVSSTQCSATNINKNGRFVIPGDNISFN